MTLSSRVMKKRSLVNTFVVVKIAGGGESAPGAADSAAAEDILGRETDKDLPHQDVLWEGDGGSGGCEPAWLLLVVVRIP
jgi:hypothetical protein